MINGIELPRDAYDRVKVRTLDDVQGDEADFVFVDFVAISHPGSAGEASDINRAATRARGMSILLMNRGTFVGYERPENHKRATALFRLYDKLAARRVTLRMWCCLNCQTDSHHTLVCTTKPQDMPDAVCEWYACGERGHNAATCPTRVCRNCRGEGHSANECPRGVICSLCDDDGHLSFACTATTRSRRMA